MNRAPGAAATDVRPGRTWRWLGVAALVVGLGLLALFGVRGWHQLQFAQRVASGEVRVETLRGWMTLPYIARLYGVPEARLREALGLPASGGEDRSLREWFTVAGIDPVVGRRRLESVILQATPAPGPTR